MKNMTIKKETLTDKDFKIIKKWIKDNNIEYLEKATKEKLSNLTYFTINYDYIPKEFFKLKNIKKLGIINRKIIPKEIYSLKNLEILFIVSYKRGYKIDKIPNGITKLKKLNTLRLSYNNLTEFPKELCDLVNLQSLMFSDSKINKFPEEISKLKNLKKFDLSGNGLISLPECYIRFGKFGSIEYV